MFVKPYNICIYSNEYRTIEFHKNVDSFACKIKEQGSFLLSVLHLITSVSVQKCVNNAGNDCFDIHD